MYMLQIIICLAILFYAIFALGWTAKELKPEMVNCFSSSEKSFSIKTPYEKYDDLGKLVVAKDSFYGNYIGRIHGTTAKDKVSVQILACIKYPHQQAIIFSEQFVSRDPYPFGSIRKFDIFDLQSYSGEIPDYKESVKTALKEALLSARQNDNIELIIRFKRKASELGCLVS